MQTANAMKNLKNRYMSVLNKCRLLNTFGSLLMASALVVVANPALADVSKTASDLGTFKTALSTTNIDDIYIAGQIGFITPNESYGFSYNDIEINGRNFSGLFGAVSANNVTFRNFDFENFSGGVFNITGAGTATITDSDFSDYGNTAITNAGTLTLSAQNDDIDFDRDDDDRRSINAINNTGTLNLTTNTNRDIEFDDNVHNTNQININGNVEFNNGLSGNGALTLNSGLVEFSKFVNIGSLTASNNARVSMQNELINSMTVGTLNGTLNLSIDVDGQSKTSDTVNITTAAAGSSVVIQNIEMLSPTTEATITIDPFSGATPVASYTGGNIISPLYTYSVSYDSTAGNITLSQGSGVNPSVQVSALSTTNASVAQFATNKRAFTRANRLMNMSNDMRAEYINTLYASSDPTSLSIQSRPSLQGVWIEPHFSTETVSSDNAADFDYTSFGFTGGYDSSFYQFGALDALFGGYLAFNMGDSDYTQNTLSQSEVSLGGSATFFMKNLYFGTTVNFGYGMNEIKNTDSTNTYYGNADYNTINAGVALIAGYNIELGSFILQPNAILSYARVGEADYTSKQGYKVEMEAINAFEFTPGIRATMNFENALQVYADAKVAIALNNDSKVSVAGVNAPEVTQGVYSEIGLGVQKDWSRFSLYGGANGKVGSRQGFGANAGFKFYF